MPLFSSANPTLKVRVLPRFPARVLVGGGITLTKSGLDYTFSLTYAPGQPPADSTTSLGNPATGKWQNLFLQAFDGVNGSVWWGPSGAGQVKISGGAGSMNFLGATAGYFFDFPVLPAVADGSTLGVASFPWSDIFLASGAVVNFSNGDIALQHVATDRLNFIGGQTSGFYFQGPILPFTTDSWAIGSLTLAFSDVFLSAGAVINFDNSDVTIQHAANQLNFTGASVGFFFDGPPQPLTNDAFALGSSSVKWSDLFLASGAVINFDSGDVAITHAVNTLTFSGASVGYFFDGLISFTTAAARAATQSDLREGVIVGGKLIGANFNSTADQAIPIVCPSPNYLINSIVVLNASISLTTAVGGIYPTTAKGGTKIVPSTQVYTTLTGAAINSAGSMLALGFDASVGTTAYNLATLYLSLTTPQGAAATADIYVLIRPVY